MLKLSKSCSTLEPIMAQPQTNNVHVGPTHGKYLGGIFFVVFVVAI